MLSDEFHARRLHGLVECRAQSVIERRVKRAQHLLRKDDELELAEVALRAGFSDQSKFSFHFKRLIGVTPRQFRLSARSHRCPQAPPRNTAEALAIGTFRFEGKDYPCRQ
jgi:AraC-like DNA-binding protein